MALQQHGFIQSSELSLWIAIIEKLLQVQRVAILVIAFLALVAGGLRRVFLLVHLLPPLPGFRPARDVDPDHIFIDGVELGLRRRHCLPLLLTLNSIQRLHGPLLRLLGVLAVLYDFDLFFLDFLSHEVSGRMIAAVNGVRGAAALGVCTLLLQHDLIALLSSKFRKSVGVVVAGGRGPQLLLAELPPPLQMTIVTIHHKNLV